METCLDWEVERNPLWRQQQGVPTVSLQATASCFEVLEQLGMNLDLVDELSHQNRSLAARAVPGE